ncbi:hypothetical protein [Kluyvera intermedia]|uniref:hypothetical protein n=1 Tax=Kluyvera intermedia TaxID=61648 RepID=UPI0035251F6B
MEIICANRKAGAFAAVMDFGGRIAQPEVAADDTTERGYAVEMALFGFGFVREFFAHAGPPAKANTPLLLDAVWRVLSFLCAIIVLPVGAVITQHGVFSPVTEL